MAEDTKIQWCDHTASPWYGCTKIATGCAHCYAEALSKRNPGTLGVWGDDGVRVKSKSFISNLEKWSRRGEREGRVRSVFPSLCDPFEDRPELDPWRREMFEAIDRLPWVRLMLLTKRPGNVRKMWPPINGCGSGPDEYGHYEPEFSRTNVSLYYSASTQADLEAGIDDLLGCIDLVPVLGLSLEPQIEHIDLTGYIPDEYCSPSDPPPTVNHIIIGGESGPGARPYNLDWPRSIIEQCREAGVPCFHKQLGSNPQYGVLESQDSFIDNIQDPKGGNWDEWSEEFKVREQPETAGAE